MLLGFRDDLTKVNDRDRLMAMALQHYEDACCSECGQPHWIGEQWERAEVRERICHWCESATSQAKDIAKGYTDGVLPSGVHLYAVDTGDPDYTPSDSPRP